MKILRCYLKIPPLEGGMEKHIGSLTACQRALGEKVDLLFNCGTATGPGDIQIWPAGNLFRLRPQSVAVTVFYFMSLIMLLRQHNRYDILHLHGDWSSLLLAGSLKKACHAKVFVFSLHDDLTTSRPHTNWLPKLVRKADLIFSTGHRTAKLVQASSGKAVIVQPSGVSEHFYIPAESYSSNGNRFTVLTVARLIPKKNLILVLDIASGLSETDFWIVGDGPDMTFLREQIARKKIGNVSMLGRKTPVEIRETMARSHCFLLTSLAEGTPTAILEAMAAGLPVVTSPAGGIETIVQNTANGYVVEDYEAESYRSAIRRLYDRSLGRKISQNNKEKALRYRWPAVTANITAAMKSALDKKHSKS